MSIKKAILYVDGAARGNPGPAGIAAVIQDEGGNPIASFSRRIGSATNNQAEYQALIAGLEKVVNLGIREVEVRSDSELVVRQLSGRYRVKNAALKPLYQRVKQLLSSIESFTISHIPRERNVEADRLANRALDGI